MNGKLADFFPIQKKHLLTIPGWRSIRPIGWIAILLALVSLGSGREAYAQEDDQLPSPVYSDYNTFLGMVNILELISANDKTVTGTVSAYRLDGARIAQQTFSIEPGKQLDIIVNDLIGRRVDTYGVLAIEYNNLSAELEGRISYYRPNPNANNLSYAYSRALNLPLSGTTQAIGNSFDPNGLRYLVPNWLQVINLAPTAKTFTVNLYDQFGTLLSVQNTTINQFERRDFAIGHDIGPGLYLAEVVPSDNSAEYSAAITRYGWNIVPGGTPRDFSFALSLDAVSGSTKNLFSLTSNQSSGSTNSPQCFRQSNWIEVVNVAATTAMITATFYDSRGNILSNQSISLAAKAQTHLNANTLLELGAAGQDFGLVKLATDTPTSLLAQSNVYYQNCRDFRIQSVYGTLATAPTISPINGSYNRFLEMQNDLIVISTTNENRQVDFGLFFEGAPLFMESIRLPAFGVITRNLNDEEMISTTADTYGSIELDSSETATFIAYTLRTRKNTAGTTIDFANLTTFR